jgi:hypothetical protein
VEEIVDELGEIVSAQGWLSLLAHSLRRNCSVDLAGFGWMLTGGYEENTGVLGEFNVGMPGGKANLHLGLLGK